MKYIENYAEYEATFSSGDLFRYKLMCMGEVWAEGSVLETGGEFFDRVTGTTSYVTEHTEGGYIKEYTLARSAYEGLCPWKVRTYTAAGEGATAVFESSLGVRKEVARYTIGNTFADVDRCCDIDMWLAASISNEEQEYFFNAESYEQLLKVATYYKLPVPVNSVYGDILDNCRMYIRFKSFQQLNGTYLSIVPASIVFRAGVAISFKLYATVRAEDWLFIDNRSAPEVCVDSTGGGYALERATYTRTADVLADALGVSRYTFLLAKEYYDASGSTTAYYAGIPNMPEAVPMDVLSVEGVHIPDTGYTGYLYRYAINNAIQLPELPHGSTVKYFGKYVDTDFVETSALPYEVWFTNSNSLEVCEEFNITVSGSAPTHFSAVFDSGYNILLVKAYFYTSSSILSW